MKVVKDISKLIWQNERCLYSSEDIASVVVGASLQNKSIEYTANAPNGDTIFERLERSLTVNDLRKYVRETRPIFRGYATAAIDEHVEIFYGDKDTDGVIGTKPKNGSSYAFSFLAVKIIVRNKEYIVDLIPLYDNKVAEHTIEALAELVKLYKINMILIDAGFRDVDLLNWIVGRDIHLITRMRTSKNLRIKDIKYNKAYLYSSLYEKGTYNSICKKMFVYRFKDKKHRDYYLLSDMDEKPSWIKDTYRLRWGIETGFRDVNRMEIKTTTKNKVIRLFFYIVSVLMYNIWIEVRSESYIRLDTLRSLLIKIITDLMESRGNLLRIMGLT